MLAVATSSDTESSIYLVDTNGGDLQSNSPSTVIVCKDKGAAGIAYNSLSFDNYSGQLASANDAGIIKIFDISSNKNVATFCPDASGIEFIKYSNSGRLFTAGMSSRGQIQIWDPRDTPKQYPVLLNSGLNESISIVVPHVSQEHILFYGTSCGRITQVDLRSGGILGTYSPHKKRGIY